ncbi:MAG: hypothetical protein ACRCY4_06105 [Brevinema sp.]
MMKNTMVTASALLLVLMVASCGGEAVPPADTAQIVGLIQQDAQAIADNPNITNELALIDIADRTNLDPNRGGMFDDPQMSTNQRMVAQAPAEEMVNTPPAQPMTPTIDPPMAEPMMNDPMMEEPMMMTPPAPVPARRRATPRPVTAPSMNTWIAVGNDRSGQRVSPRNTKKITVVLQNRTATYADVSLYAVPAGSARPIMNTRTLIGFARNFDVINGQAQFTRYWNAANTGGTFLTRGAYNVYMAYSYKDRNGRVVASGGRYWGGTTPIIIRVD